MQTSIQHAGASAWQRQRALKLAEICGAMKREIEGGLTVLKAAQKACNAFAPGGQGPVLDDGKRWRTLALSVPALTRHYYQWKAQGETLAAFSMNYKGRTGEVPAELITELRRRCTLPGIVNSSVVIKSFEREWKQGKEVAGLGAWSTWWAQKYPGIPVPNQAPEFPISSRTLYRYAPRGAARTWGNKGLAAARKQLPWLTRDYSKLRPAELYVFDDVRLDILAMDDYTRKPTELNCYIAIEAACRLIPAFILRPANAMKKFDVDTLVVRSLRTLGIGPNYQTHLYFERGMLTMSAEAAETLEKVSEGRIKPHFTSMNSGRTYVGAHADVAVGHWMGKAVIESFMRKLHLALMMLPGQRGNNYSNQPASLGWVGQGQLPAPGTLAREAEMLADIEAAFGRRVKLNLGLMWASDVFNVVRQAMDFHNGSRDHQYQGFSTITQTETAPGVWKDVVA